MAMSLLFLGHLVDAQVPHILNYQERVSVNGATTAAQSDDNFRIVGVQLCVPNQLCLSWCSSANSYYQVEATTNLAEAFAPASGATRADEPTCEITLALPNAVRCFYRVKLLDTDAGAYCQRAGITNVYAVSALNDWVAGLKSLGLFSNAVFMASLRGAQNQGHGTTLYALRGPDGVLINDPTWDDSGLLFTGNQAVEFANPFPTNYLTQFSLFAFFGSDQQPYRTIMGSWLWTEGNPQYGPVLIAGASPAQGADGHELFFEYSTDGQNVPWLPVSGRRTFNIGNTGTLQFSLFTYSPTNMSLQTNIDTRYQTTTSYPAAWNGNSRWRLGACLNGAWPFVGTLSFAAAFDVALSQAQYDAVRRLYQTTLGTGLNYPPVNLIIEGDSLSAEGIGIDYGLHLLNQPNWTGKFNKHNVAQGGEGIGQMLAEFPTQALPIAAERGRNYLFLWAGCNNIGQNYSAADTFAGLINYWLLARAAGFKVGAFTVLKAASDTSSIITECNKLNALIRANGDQYDWLIDVAALPTLANPSNTTYFADGVHLTSIGYNEVATLINSTIPTP